MYNIVFLSNILYPIINKGMFTNIVPIETGRPIEYNNNSEIPVPPPSANLFGTLKCIIAKE